MTLGLLGGAAFSSLSFAVFHFAELSLSRLCWGFLRHQIWRNSLISFLFDEQIHCFAAVVTVYLCKMDSSDDLMKIECLSRLLLIIAFCSRFVCFEIEWCNYQHRFLLEQLVYRRVVYSAECLNLNSVFGFLLGPREQTGSSGKHLRLACSIWTWYLEEQVYCLWNHCLTTHSPLHQEQN